MTPQAIGFGYRHAGFAPPAARDSVTFRGQQAAKLKVTTAEGDEVTISFRARQSLRADSQSARASSSVDLHVSLKGDLSPAELEDLQKLIAGFNHPQEPASQLDTIQSYDFRYHESIRAGAVFRLEG